MDDDSGARIERFKDLALIALDRHQKLTVLRRKCTLKQRAFLAALPQHHYQKYSAAVALGLSSGTVWRWLRQPEFLEAYGIIMDAAFEEVGVSHASIVSRLDVIANRCMQAAPVLDKKGEPVLLPNAEGDAVPAYVFDPAGSLRALETLAKIQKLTVDRHELTGKDGESLGAPVINIVRYDDDRPAD